ncbi:restriction endonuclease subunit S [Ruminococcus sp.]|uniref:restriction endonuclease subunit S n=1 Tax=Ruminococcus sp. TaxID=41978 RepID=UPI003A90BBFC
MNKTPAVRFIGFAEDWEQRKLGDLLQTLPFKQFLKEPEPDGKYEIIQQGNEPVIGFANGTPCGDYKDVVIFGDHTLSLYKPQHPFFVATDGVRIVKGQQDTDGYYLLSLLERYKPQSEGYKRYYSILADTNCITTYNTSEQEKIGVFFKLLDNLITLHQRKYDKLTNVKKSMLEKMFPKNGSNVPEIRFKGFTDAWEQRKLGDVLVLLKDGTHGTHKDAESGPLLLSAKNIKNGTIQWDESDRRISEDEYNNIHSNFKLQKGDVLLTIVGSIGETAILSQSKGVTFQRSVAFLRPSDKISSEFLYSEIQGQKFQKALNVRKSTSAQPGIYLGDLGTIPIEFPTSDEEQMQIGSYFQNLDNLITLHHRKFEKLEQIKQAMLHKMFV